MDRPRVERSGKLKVWSARCRPLNVDPLASTEMLETIRDNLTLSFPEVHDRAALRLSFRKADTPKEIAPLAAQHDAGFVLGSAGRFVLHLRPRPLAGSDWEW